MVSNAVSSITYSGNNSTTTAYPVTFDYVDADHIKVSILAVGTGTVVVTAGAAVFSSAQSTLEVGSHVRIAGTIYTIDTRTSTTEFTFTTRPTIASSSFYLTDDATELNNGQFTLTEVGTGAPYVTTGTAYASTYLVKVYREVPYTQLVEFATSGPIPAESIEEALDTVTMQVQQLAEIVENSGIVVPAFGATGAYGVNSFGQLQAALALGTQTRIELYADITLTAAITFNTNHTLVPRNHLLVDGGFGITFNGNIEAGRQQVFSGFVAGDITGSFGSGVVFPEWWGLTDGYHDIAINAAAAASPVATTFRGIVVSLAARKYNVSAPIDLTAKYVRLEGAGSALTELESTADWVPTSWYETKVWTGVTSTANHSALVWIGSALQTGTTNSFRSCVTGMTIDCLYATDANWTKYVSGISSPSWVEENSYIYDVVVNYASGMGIGFPEHGPTYGDGAVINGLKISNVWISGSSKRTSYGMYFTHWVSNCEVENFTLDFNLPQDFSSAYTGTVPDPIRDWPLIGIRAGGKLHIKSGHIESCGIGIFVCQNEGGGGNNVTIENVEGYVLMDRGAGQEYTEDYTVGTVDGASDYSGTMAATTLLELTDGTTAGMVPTQAILISGAVEAAYNDYHIVERVVSATEVAIDLAWPGSAPTGTPIISLAEPAPMYSTTISTAVDYNATRPGTTLLTVGSTVGMKALDNIVISGANGVSSASYNGTKAIDTVVNETTVAITLAWPGNATTAGNVALALVNTARTNASFWDAGTVVLIAREAEADGPLNAKDKVTLINVVSKGSCKYVLRDLIYGQEITPYGKGVDVTNASGGVAFYSRGNAYLNDPRWPHANGGSATYDFTAPNTTRTFFLGPIY